MLIYLDHDRNLLLLGFVQRSWKALGLVVNLLPPALGSDFLFYGPIENAGSAFDIARFGYELAREGIE